MAICPRCKREILWDNCQDAYIYGDSGEYLKEKTVIDSAETETEIKLVLCDCGEVVGIWYIHPDQVTVFNQEEWAEIDWLSKENSYPCP